MELGLLTEILQPLPIPMPDIPMPEEGLEVGVLAMGAAVDDMSIPDIPVAMFIDSMAGSDSVACAMEQSGVSTKEEQGMWIFVERGTGR